MTIPDPELVKDIYFDLLTAFSRSYAETASNDIASKKLSKVDIHGMSEEHKALAVALLEASSRVLAERLELHEHHQHQS